jgi:hypothetical protein
MTNSDEPRSPNQSFVIPSQGLMKPLSESNPYFQA